MEAEIVMSGESALSQVFSALWFILPAYLANGGAMVVGGGSPLDGGRSLPDGKRILGDGVTIRGTLGGILIGTSVGGIQGSVSSTLSFGLALGLAMGLGAIVGDMAGSFVKRRLGIQRGGSAPGLDQLGFLILALAFASILTTVSSTRVMILLILTPTIHLCTNAIAYQLRIKKVWY